jgi:hypothetical protein
VRGNKIVSPAALDKAIVNLDRDGKLDFVFGKQGAQQLRDINDIAKDVYTSPPGAINTSNTGSVMLEALGEIATGRLSTGTAKALAQAKNFMKNRATRRRVGEALDFDPAAPKRKARAAEILGTLHE